MEGISSRQGPAPGGPYVDENHPAVVVGQRNGGAFGIRDREVRRRVTGDDRLDAVAAEPCRPQRWPRRRVPPGRMSCLRPVSVHRGPSRIGRISSPTITRTAVPSSTGMFGSGYWPKTRSTFRILYRRLHTGQGQAQRHRAHPAPPIESRPTDRAWGRWAARGSPPAVRSRAGPVHFRARDRWR